VALALVEVSDATADELHRSTKLKKKFGAAET
jgi:hypothetical protein